MDNEITMLKLFKLLLPMMAASGFAIAWQLARIATALEKLGNK